MCYSGGGEYAIIINFVGCGWAENSKFKKEKKYKKNKKNKIPINILKVNKTCTILMCQLGGLVKNNKKRVIKEIIKHKENEK